jgi:hypothetical protein
MEAKLPGTDIIPMEAAKFINFHGHMQDILTRKDKTHRNAYFYTNFKEI